MLKKSIIGISILLIGISFSGCKTFPPKATPVVEDQIQPYNEPMWSDFVKDYYPEWRKHYWTDKELWGNRGYIVGTPPLLPEAKEEDFRSRAGAIGPPVQMLHDITIQEAPKYDEIVVEEPGGLPEPLKPTRHVVLKGECLWYIAGYEHIYGDPLKWPLIYKANRNKIKDPDLIYPGQVFVIPRN